jgi:hypothetical protein
MVRTETLVEALMYAGLRCGWLDMSFMLGQNNFRGRDVRDESPRRHRQMNKFRAALLERIGQSEYRNKALDATPWEDMA